MSYFSSYAFGIPDWDAHEILPDVFLGSAAAAQACKELEERNITHIISINHSPDYIPFYPKQFECLVVLAEDDLYQEMLSIMLDCFSFIDECLAKNGRVLIHCTAGVSRSATVVAAHVMRECGLNADAAITLLQKFRPYVQPNLAFSAQLRLFHEIKYNLSKLKHETAVAKLKSYHKKPNVHRYWKGAKFSTKYIQYIQSLETSKEDTILFYSILPSRI
eukprot:Phypoly_transcript_18087.p1 GENE.Phypoly_transcript_18087~~Phypoly_transcript_18087.p1  ORF type:complete len:219 (+),score=11.68 Phypoly_transcript_18087:110-766(+)